MPASPWLHTLPPPAPPLVDDGEADVVVVGAGFTGLSTALALRAEGRAVTVLESTHAGFGASGRNAGHLTPVIGKDLPTLASLYGKRRGKALVGLVDTAMAHVETLIARHGIACDYEPVGNVMAAVGPAQHGVLDKAARAAEQLGLDAELLEPAAMRARDLPAAFTRGLLWRRGGILDPGRYVLGLRQAAVDAGVVLHEGSPVTSIGDDAPAVVTTPGGRLRARDVVLATNAWTPTLGRLGHVVLPIHVRLFRTAPLSPAQHAAIGWSGREGVYTAHEMLESYRLTADGAIVGGSKTVRAAAAGHDPADAGAMDAEIERAFRERFPALRDLPIVARWGGPLGFALDFLPAVGRTGRAGNVWYSAAYAGHGIALASYAGTMLADLMAGRDGPGAALWAHRKPPLPPGGPLRRLVVRALVGVFGMLDERVDRTVRRSPHDPAH